MLLTKPVPEIEDWIKGIAGVDVSYGQASDMRKKLQAEAEAWKNLPEVKSSADRFQADAHDFSADRSSSLQDDVRALTNSEVEAANQRIQLRAKNLTGEQRIEQMGGIVKEEYAKATGALDALKKDIQARSVAFDTQFLAARNKRINFEKGITDARSSGLLTRGEFNAANDQNHRASDVSTYTEDPRVQNAVSRLFNDPLSREAALLGKPWATQEDARLRAMEMARQWALTERPKYESQGDADNAFTEFVNTKMRREVASTLGLEGASEPPGPASKPGGPSIPALDQAKDGKDFQVVLDGGDKGALKLAAVKAYPAGSKSPQSLTKFQASFGQANGSMPKIRGDARKDLVAMTRSGQLDQTTRTALLNTGAASPGELLRGAIVENGVTIPIKPEEVDIWKTMVFTSTIQFRKAYNDDRAMLRSLSKMYGVQDADFAVWAKQQGLLLKVNGL
jgi:hypothetical protein